MKNILKITLCLLIGILIGYSLSQLKTNKVISEVDNTKYYNSQTEFYDNIIKDVNTLEIYDSSELTPEILTNRNGKIVIEKVVGKVTNYKLDGTILNANVNNGTYITYKRVDRAKEGDTILTYFIYNPFTNAPDDVLTRLDFIIDDNAI